MRDLKKKDKIRHSHFYIEKMDYLRQCDEVSEGGKCKGIENVNSSKLSLGSKIKRDFYIFK